MGRRAAQAGALAGLRFRAQTGGHGVHRCRLHSGPRWGLSHAGRHGLLLSAQRKREPFSQDPEGLGLLLPVRVGLLVLGPDLIATGGAPVLHARSVELRTSSMAQRAPYFGRTARVVGSVENVDTSNGPHQRV